MITKWYPTPTNPYNGVFFKEQALALANNFDFIIIHYFEKKRDLFLKNFIRKIIGKEFVVEEVNREKNTVEYNITVYFPVYLVVLDTVYDMYIRVFKRRSEPGVGRYVSKKYQKRKKKILDRIFSENFKNTIDIFYCVDAQKESYTLKCAAEALNKPYVVAEHAPFPWPGDVIKDNEKEAIEAANLFMAISYDKIRQVLLQNVKPKRIALVGNLVNEEQFKLRNGDNKVKTFLIVAAHSFYKNYDLFIEIFNKLTEITDKPFKVMIVGYGSNKGYSKNAEVLEDKIKSSKFAKFSELIPAVAHEDIHEIYQKADAFVMTSIQEGMPVSALEAACCGLPIFSTMCGGVEDYVTDEIGRIYKIIDSASFAEGLKLFMEEKISFNGQYIRSYIIEKYGNKAFTERMEKLFNDVISQR